MQYLVPLSHKDLLQAILMELVLKRDPDVQFSFEEVEPEPEPEPPKLGK